MIEPIIQFKHIKKRFNDQTVTPDLNFTVNEGEFIAILGSSGSGKTTTLKMTNGLIAPSTGEILVDGQKLRGLDLVKLCRHMGYVVQQIGLSPHMTIGQNIAIVPRTLHWDEEEINNCVKELPSLIQLNPAEYMNRYPQRLSGGQQQRVGVARALATNPSYVLFDEPFGALDALTRMELQREVKRIHESLAGGTFMFVTHDTNEALFLGQRVMIMHEGRIVQFATPEGIVRHPAMESVRQLLGMIRQNQDLWRQQYD